MLHTHEAAGSSPAPPTRFDGEAPLRRLNPFPPRPLWGERVQGEGGACSWRMNLRPQGDVGGRQSPWVARGGSEGAAWPFPRVPQAYGWLGPGLAPRTRPGDPTNDSRSGDRPELTRMFRSGRSGASQRWIGVNRPGSAPGRTTPPPLVGWVPRPASTLRSTQARAIPR